MTQLAVALEMWLEEFSDDNTFLVRTMRGLVWRLQKTMDGLE